MNAHLDDLFFLALAVWQAVEVWQHSTLFADKRAAIQSWPTWESARTEIIRGNLLKNRPRWRIGIVRQLYDARSWLADMLLCPWCLSVWVGFLLAAAWFGLPDWLQWINVFTMGLAVSRAANVLNDLTAGFSKTPKADDLPDEEVKK